MVLQTSRASRALVLIFFVSAACSSPTTVEDAGLDGSSSIDAGEVAGAHDAAAPRSDGGGGGDDAGARPPECTLDCGAHGRCELRAEEATCACDTGWRGSGCSERSREQFDRVQVARHLADPAALVLDDGRVVFSGTRGGRTLPLIESTDLRTFVDRGAYDPHALDPAHDYCWVWAPDLSRRADGYHLYFSAHRVPAGSACPPGDQTETTYHARGETPFTLGAPEAIHPGTVLPRTYPPRGCPAQGCRHAIRIDSTATADGADEWLHYVWFNGGNNISAFRWADPARVIDVTGPATRFGGLVGTDEETINEAPELFERDGRYYLFFSTGWFDSQYAMRFLVGPSVEELTRARATRRHSRAPRGASGALLESHGHNTIIERDGEYFNVFHQGAFEGGRMVRRDTYVQRMAFHPDGTPHSLNLIDVRWGALPGRRYSLDLVLRDGTVVGPCIAVGRIGGRTHVEFGGVCPDAADRLVPKSLIERFRIFHSDSDTWSEFAEVEYDGHSDDVYVPLPGGSPTRIPVRWNELETGAEYSLDIRRTDGTWVAPCEGAAVIGSWIGHDYTGRCRSAASDVPIADVRAVRVCSAVGGRWDRARCGEAEWRPGAARVDVHIP